MYITGTGILLLIIIIIQSIIVLECIIAPVNYMYIRPVVCSYTVYSESTRNCRAPLSSVHRPFHYDPVR